MGTAVDRERYAEHEFDVFRERLVESVDRLRALLRDPEFGKGPTSIGAELEDARADEPFTCMLEAYLDRVEQGAPVHTWTDVD